MKRHVTVLNPHGSPKVEIIAGNVVTKGYRDVDWVVTNGIDGGGGSEV